MSLFYYTVLRMKYEKPQEGLQQNSLRKQIDRLGLYQNRSSFRANKTSLRVKGQTRLKAPTNYMPEKIGI